MHVGREINIHKSTDSEIRMTDQANSQTINSQTKTDRQAGRQAGRERERDRQTDRQTDTIQHLGKCKTSKPTMCFNLSTLDTESQKGR